MIKGYKYVDMPFTFSLAVFLFWPTITANFSKISCSLSLLPLRQAVGNNPSYLQFNFFLTPTHTHMDTLTNTQQQLELKDGQGHVARNRALVFSWLLLTFVSLRECVCVCVSEGSIFSLCVCVCVCVRQFHLFLGIKVALLPRFETKSTIVIIVVVVFAVVAFVSRGGGFVLFFSRSPISLSQFTVYSNFLMATTPTMMGRTLMG